MPKIYFKSKDVNGVDVLKWNGVCYTKTGVYKTPSHSSNIPLSDVTLFYGDCNTCDGGEKTVTAGTTTTILSTDGKFQLKVGDLSPGQQAGLEFVGETSCVVVLSADQYNRLIFDVAGVGNGPHTFTSIGETFNFMDCNNPPLEYDITYTGNGSYYLTVESKSSPIPLTGDESIELQTEYDMDLTELTEDEQLELQSITSDITSEQLGVDNEHVVTYLVPGSIIANTTVDNLSIERVEKLQQEFDGDTLTKKLSAEIDKSTIRETIKQRLHAQRKRMSHLLRRSLVKNKYNMELSSSNTLCYVAGSGRDLAGKFEQLNNRKVCNPTIYMKDDEQITIKVNQPADYVFDIVNNDETSIATETTYYASTGLPLTGPGEVTVSLTPGFTGNLHYRETAGNIVGNPGPNMWNVPAGGKGLILVRKTKAPEGSAVNYKPTVRTNVFLSGGDAELLTTETRVVLRDTIKSVVMQTYENLLIDLPFKIGVGFRKVIDGVLIYIYTYTGLSASKDDMTSIVSSLTGAEFKTQLTLNIQSISNSFMDSVDGIMLPSSKIVRPAIVCAQDVKTCWDDTVVNRNPDLRCAFNPCPAFPVDDTTGKSIEYKLVPQGTTGYNVEDLTRLKKQLGLNAPIKHIDIHDTVILQNNTGTHPVNVEMLDINGDVLLNVGNDANGTVSFRFKDDLLPTVITHKETLAKQLHDRLVSGLPIKLEYYCTSHPNTMRGHIYVHDRSKISK